MFYFYGESTVELANMHASVVSIASAIFAMVFPTPEMIFMNINEWRIRSYIRLSIASPLPV